MELHEGFELKSTVRIMEKSLMRFEDAGKVERVCDVVRDQFLVDSMMQAKPL